VTTTSAFVWITARDGSIHATRPPILASGQAMLCSRAYGRRDLRLRIVPRLSQPVGACTPCCVAALDSQTVPQA